MKKDILALEIIDGIFERSCCMENQNSRIQVFDLALSRMSCDDECFQPELE